MKGRLILAILVAGGVMLTLSTDSNGNRKVTVTDHSPCDSPGMCGERSTNR